MHPPSKTEGFFTEEHRYFIKTYFVWCAWLGIVGTWFTIVTHPADFHRSLNDLDDLGEIFYKPLLWNYAALIAAALAGTQTHNRNWLRCHWERTNLYPLSDRLIVFAVQLTAAVCMVGMYLIWPRKVVLFDSLIIVIGCIAQGIKIGAEYRALMKKKRQQGQVITGATVPATPVTNHQAGIGMVTANEMPQPNIVNVR